MKVADILHKKGDAVFAVSSNQSVLDALKLMSEKNIGAVPVIDDGKLTGILSERDYARKVVLKGKSSQDTRIHEIMTPNPFTVSPDEKLDALMALMNDKKIRHLPVVENNAVVGMVSVGDVVSAIIASQKEMITHLQNYLSL